MIVKNDHKTISIADQIFENLEKDILSGKYERGETLSENRLCEELGVSRTPIREAIKRLLQEHIIEEGKHGLIVVGISKEDMLDFYEIRILIEGNAAAKAARYATEDNIKEMKECLELQKYYVEKDGAPGEYADNIKDLDSKFHSLIYKSSGSLAYADILEIIHKKMTKFRKASVSKKSRAKHSLSEHIAILDAITKGDELKAKEKMTEHIINARDSIAKMAEIK